MFIGHKIAHQLNVELNHYGRELYDAFTEVTAQNSEFLLNFPMGTFSVDTPFSVHFLKISASEN